MQPTLDQFLRGRPVTVGDSQITYLAGRFESKNLKTGQLSIESLLPNIGWLTEAEYVRQWYWMNVKS